MMITALAEAGDALEEPKYLAAAKRASSLLWVEDYPFLGEGLVALYHATGNKALVGAPES